MKITNTNKVSTQARILTSLGDEMKRVGGSLETSSIYVSVPNVPSDQWKMKR